MCSVLSINEDQEGTAKIFKILFQSYFILIILHEQSER